MSDDYYSRLNLEYSSWHRLLLTKKRFYDKAITPKEKKRAKRDIENLIKSYPEYFKRFNKPQPSDDEIRQSGGFVNVNPMAKDF